MPSLSTGTRVGYSLGGIATGTYGTVPGLLLMPFLTDQIGVPAAIAGLIVFAPKSWDFFLNPVAGRISDRSKHPTNRRRPFLIRAGLVMAVGFLAMFLGPLAPPAPAAGWVLAVFLMCATAYAFFQVPYLAMSAEITDDYAERTRLMTWRVVVITLGIVVSGATAPLLVDIVGGATGYRVMAAVMAVLIALGTLGVWWGTRRTTLTRLEQAGGTLREQLVIVVTNPHARTLLSAYVLQAVAMGMVLAGIAYMARYVAHDPAMATYAFAAFVAPAIVVTPLWGRLGRRVGKKAGFVASSFVLITGLAALLFSHGGNQVVLLAAAAAVGVGYAGGQLFPLAMMPDIAAQDAAESGQNRIGVLAGVWSGFELLGYALGPAIYGIVLAIGGYVSATGEEQTQTGSAVWAIVLGVSVVPAVLAALSLLPLSRYRLDAQLREQITSAN